MGSDGTYRRWCPWFEGTWCHPVFGPLSQRSIFAQIKPILGVEKKRSKLHTPTMIKFQTLDLENSRIKGIEKAFENMKWIFFTAMVLFLHKHGKHACSYNRFWDCSRTEATANPLLCPESKHKRSLFGPSIGPQGNPCIQHQKPRKHFKTRSRLHRSPTIYVHMHIYHISRIYRIYIRRQYKI